MVKQLELEFKPDSEIIRKLKKEIPDFKKHGFQSDEEWKKAKAHDRAWRHMEQMNKIQMKKGLKDV
jgi:molybdopterin synthase catalytic subunit|tara:strand:+ start:1474 stop:1671 length:198 start_codon:yes stop_codon:yes gene_type:complete